MDGAHADGERAPCATCGESHAHLAGVFGPQAPNSWLRATPDDRRHGMIAHDLCTLAGEFFVRCHLEIPVDAIGDEIFVWSVWARIDASDFDDLVERWDDLSRIDLPRIAGLLDSELPYTHSTLGLPCEVQARGPGEVPRLLLKPVFAHELVHEQAEGVTLHRVAQFNRQVLG